MNANRHIEIERCLRIPSACVLLICVWAWVAVAHAYDPLAGDYSKESPHDVRVMTYNHAGRFISDPSRDAAFNRILTAINPDVIVFEEFAGNISAAVIANRLNSVLPNPGVSWQVHLGIVAGTRNVIVSRYPLLLQRTDTVPTSSTRGVTIALADLPDDLYAADIYLLGVHLKCCGDPGGSEDESRQRSADAIANWLADARGVARPFGNRVTLAADTPMIVLGDFNMVGGPQPELTLLTGDIQDNVTFGPDVKGDWDSTDITDLGPADPFTGATFTWQGSGGFPPSNLDRIMFTDSVLVIANSFVFNTATMTAAARTAAGVQATDTATSNTSDHLPVVADLRLTGVMPCAGDGECDDGNACNGAESCVDQTCVSGTPLICNDNNLCTDDACQPDIGCVFTPNSATCDDGNACTLNDVCSGGDCTGQPMVCDDGNVCTDDFCLGGTCYFLDNVQPCDDGDTCTEGDECWVGACSGTPRNCDDGQFCNGIETCDSQAGCLPADYPCNATEWCDKAAEACVPLGNGDFNADGMVNLLDAAAFQACFGQPATPACAPGNIVGQDGAVDHADLAAFITVLEGP